MITDPNRLLPAPYKARIICAGHLERALNPMMKSETVENIIRILRAFDFEAIAIRGLSGALMAPIVAMALNKTLIIVRKIEEIRHSGYIVEGDYNARRYVILDDMISSGATVSHILKEVRVAIPSAQCIGCLQYLWLNDRSRVELTNVSIYMPRSTPAIVPAASWVEVK